jgi:hypothetical protein
MVIIYEFFSNVLTYDFVNSRLSHDTEDNKFSTSKPLAHRLLVVGAQ